MSPTDTNPNTEHTSDGPVAVKALEEAMEEAIEEEVLDYSLIEDYEPIASEFIGVGVENWNQISRKIAHTLEQARLKRYVARTMHDAGKPVEEEAKKIEEAQLPPLRRELLVQTRRLVALLTDAQNVRDQINNWLAIQPNLRNLLWKGLRLEGIDMTSMRTRVEEREKAVRESET